MLPVPAMPTSPLLISACVSNTCLWRVSKRKPILMRLKMSGGLLSMSASTMVPPERPSCQSLTSSLGGSRCASSVMRLAPEMIFSGATSTPPGIPRDIEFSRVDRHGIIRRIGVDDVARTHDDFALEIGRQTVAAEFTLELAGKRQVGAIRDILQSQREQDVAGRDILGANVDGAHAIRSRPDGNPQRPRLGAVLTEAQRHAAAARPAKAEIDVFEFPFVAALLVVDDQIAVLQADLVEVLAVKTGEAEAVEPIETGEHSACRRT